MDDRWPQLRAQLADGKDASQAVHATSAPTVSVPELVNTWRDLRASMAGPGRAIEELLADPAVTDVLINPTGLWVDRGGRLQSTAIELGDSTQVRALAVRMAAAAGVRLDDARPIADGILPDGTRLHAVLSPPAVDGTVISLRTSRRQAFCLDELVECGTVDSHMRDLIDNIITRRLTGFISGATGSGKTTLLTALLSAFPAHERIIAIEQIAELNPHHPHVVTLTARESNVEGEGAVTLTDLVHAAMRMRPDRLVLGECRGAEVVDVLAAFNTGHDGGWATIHANAAGNVPSRLIALGALAGMSPDTVAAQAHAAIDVVIHIERAHHGQRVVREIAVVEPELPLRITPAYRSSPLSSAPVPRSGGRSQVSPPLGAQEPGWSVLERKLHEH
ncbi:MAG: TadA family conjugal transfer-associated ATPase [Actinomycetaceae bacterium]|nr:TadA family conjugal transfer-associated ATPase [Actinomycetaceae bacterium]